MFKKLKPRKSASRWLEAGETELELDKHFTIIKKLGRGSFATVYQVKRHEDGMMYALKVADVMSLSPLDQVDAVNEIRLLASLHHPNLTTFFEAFCDHGKLCIVQELVGGGDVSGLIKRRAAVVRHFTEDQVWATFLQIALGLQYLHHNHIMHRDLKPANLLVTDTGVVKVADLGIAQLLDRVFANTTIGTPHYMAPEMWRRQPYSYSADVWALGCILHELCTLRPLFLGGSHSETRVKVLEGVIPPLPAHYSPELTATVAWLLQPSPAARPTADDLLHSPAAQRHMPLLPEELRQRCISPALSSEQDLARLMRPIQVPMGSEDWELLNELMPTPRYPSGSSVAGALVRSKNWKSTGDLQALAARSASSPAGPSPLGASPQPGSVVGRSSTRGLTATPPPPAAQLAAAMRKSASQGSLALSEASQCAGSLAAAAEAQMERSRSRRMERRSAAVGEILQALHGEASSNHDSECGAGALRVPTLPWPALPVLPTTQQHAQQAGMSEVPAGNPLGVALAGPPRHPEPAAAAGAVLTLSGRLVGRAAVRSRSLSVDNAVEVLARGPPLPDVDVPRSSAQQVQQAQQQVAAGPAQPPADPATPVAPLVGGVDDTAAVGASRKAARPRAAPKAAVRFDLPPALAAEEVQAGVPGEVQASAARPAQQPVVQQQARPQAPAAAGKPPKKKSFWKALTGSK